MFSLLKRRTAKSEDSRIFYVALQRSGTKSFSEFFLRNGYSAASWPQSDKNGWSLACVEGRYDDILNSSDFRMSRVFEDAPWFDPALIKYVYWALPNSRFVYFERPIADWISSLKSHSCGRAPGNPKLHSIFYARLEEYYAKLEAGESPQLLIEGAENHYAAAYRNHWLQLRAFFEDKPPERFFCASLYDDKKWANLSEAWDLDFEFISDVHVHRSGFPKKMDHASKLN